MLEPRSQRRFTGKSRHSAAQSSLASRLRRVVAGEVLFDPLSRGRYATDASIYQIDPLGVVVPRNAADVVRTLEVAALEGVPVLPRGAGTSQGGQAVGEALVLDTSKYLNRVVELNKEERWVTVEPGMVLDDLNGLLRPHGLFFPVDVATSSRATLGGMAGNNSSGSRSIRYGLMVDNVTSIRALLADGEEMCFAQVAGDSDPPGARAPAHLVPGLETQGGEDRYAELVRKIRALYAREAEELERRVPKVLRHVAGYNLHRVSSRGWNMADLLVGSEGTLAFFTQIRLRLQPIPRHCFLGVCHFATFSQAMDSVRHLVELGPTAVELFDGNLLDLGRQRALFRSSIQRFVRGDPAALLLVEFTADEARHGEQKLRRLDELMAELGYPGAVLFASEPGLQEEIWAVRKAGLNIMMSMKGDAKPVSFIEDCAVPLEHLAEYTARLDELFQRHGTEGTWYAHASVGCLHVRPLLNLKQEAGLKKLRALAEGAHALVQELGGSHSGEHGDGLVRSEFLEPILGSRLVRAFEEVKHSFDPAGRFNPGKIVRPPAMDDRSLLRYPPGYAAEPMAPALDWSPWGGWLGAVEMCNNNGVCRKRDPGVMCPSYRVTRDEKHLTRGRANSLRLALSGQLGRLAEGALASSDMYETMDLCISCKACRRECPTGVDMARMKIEFLHHYRARHGLPLMDRVPAYLPYYAPLLARMPGLANLRNRIPALARLGESLLGLSARRRLPRWRRDTWSGAGPVRDGADPGAAQDSQVVLLVDTFNTYFEPENAWAALRVLETAGYRVVVPRPIRGRRPLCCGRTFLAAGLVEKAKAEARRTLEALWPYVERQVPVVGIEPSCLLTLRDELPALMPGPRTSALADRALLLTELLAQEGKNGPLAPKLGPLPTAKVLVHGHCHEKAFAAMDGLVQVLGWVPGLEVEVIESGCCGMAGSFGYETRHHELSMKMAELDLLPAVRSAAAETWLVADGISCRHQIEHGSGRQAWHAARVLEAALRPPGPSASMR